MLRREGYEVFIAADGNTAITEFDKHGPDLVLLDLMLPGISGTEVCRIIREYCAGIAGLGSIHAVRISAPGALAGLS